MENPKLISLVFLFKSIHKPHVLQQAPLPEKLNLQHRVIRATAEKQTRLSIMAALRKVFSQIMDTISLAHCITESNIKAFVTPTVLAGMFAVASGGVTADIPSWGDLAIAVPKVALYIWLYDLYFDCSNQKDPGSIEEDRLNKPWRAIPSGRLSVESAETWYKCSIVILPVVALWFGALPEAIAFMLETQAYDRLGGGSTWWGRSIINPLFFSTSQLGAIRVAAGTSTTLSKAAYQWCGLRKITFSSPVSRFPRYLFPACRGVSEVCGRTLGEAKTTCSLVFFIFQAHNDSCPCAGADPLLNTPSRITPEPAPRGCHVLY